MRLFYLKYKVFIFTATGLIIVISLIYFLLLPKYNQLSTYQLKLQENNQQLANLEFKKHKIENQEEELADLKEKLNQLQILVPKKINDADLIAQVDALARQTNLKLTSVGVEKPEEKIIKKTNQLTKSSSSKSNIPAKSTATSKLKQVTLQASVIGDFNNIEIFIEQLGLLDRLGSVHNVTFSQSENGTQAR